MLFISTTTTTIRACIQIANFGPPQDLNAFLSNAVCPFCLEKNLIQIVIKAVKE